MTATKNPANNGGQKTTKPTPKSVATSPAPQQAASSASGKHKFPKQVGACADRLYELRQKRLEMQKAVDAVADEEKALKDHIINTLPKSEASGVAGKVARVTVVTKDVPQVDDYDAFYEYVRKNKAFDLLQRRLNTSAVEERLEAGKQIPGVKIFHAVSVSLSKV